jgi:TIR domain
LARSTKATARKKAFLSYSHRDERFRKALEAHLAMLKRNGVLGLWHDRRIGPGENLDDEIDSNLRTADLILLLVSPDFIASDYCYSTELRLAMELHAAGKARVVPVILRPVEWSDAPFSKMMALPTDGKPISTWRNRDEAYVDVARGIRKVLDGLSPTSRTKTTDNWLSSVDEYKGSVLQVGGVGSRLVTKKAWLTSEHAYLPADDYVIHSFNGGGDVLWVHCPEEFDIVEVASPTSNSVFPMVKDDPRFPHGMLITNQLQNTIVVTCKRKRRTDEEPRSNP